MSPDPKRALDKFAAVELLRSIGTERTQSVIELIECLDRVITEMYPAVAYALDRAQRDADFGYVCDFVTETHARLCAAEAAFTGEQLDDVKGRRQDVHWEREPRMEEYRARIEELEAELDALRR